MPSERTRKRLSICALSLALALRLPGGGVMPSGAAPGALVASVVAGAAVAVPDRAEARGASRSSGGYSRPSVRTPSTRPSYTAPRTPSSGGYSRPSGGDWSRRPSVGLPSAGDRSISRQSSGEALERYRAQERARTAPPPPTGYPGYPQRTERPAPSDWTLPFPRRERTPSTWTPSSGRTYDGRWGRGFDPGWSPPPYAQRAPQSFGVWNALFLWFLLDTLTRPGHADFFHNHQDDPGYREWRAQADRLARDNADLRAKLDSLDRQLAERQGQARNPNYLPPDATAEAAHAGPPPGTEASSGWVGLLLALLLLGGAVLFLVWLWRRRRAHRRASGPGGPAVEPIKTAANIVRQKLWGGGDKPGRFRVGMTLTMDPTPFILAAGATKVPVPQATGSSLLVNVQSVGALRDGVALDRLYLDERSFFQLHLDASGTPDECRYFGLIDEVTPATNDEWGFWLDPDEGMIGWPEFQTKDGKTYGRAWAPGTSRVEPRAYTETQQTLGGAKVLKGVIMLYAGPTGAAAPAPETEYILVSTIETDGQAWVAIHAGIDVNPAALSLA